MSNLEITYKYPWLLLLLVPAILLTLIPYFRLDKKYRFTRNKILSMTFHIIAMVLAVNILSGVSFNYEVPNEDSEVILLVDVSDSTLEAADARDEFVRSVINICPEGCKVGVVKFGYGHSYSVKLTRDRERALDGYLSSENPSGNATALADALKYTSSLFTSKKTAKIVVVSDGIQTDGDALGSLSEIASQGIRVDTAYVSNGESEDIQIVSATVKEKEIIPGESFTVDLLIKCNSVEGEEAAVLRLYDNGKLYGETVIAIQNGDCEGSASLTISERGLHELTFELVTDHELFGEPLKDGEVRNNTYRTYINLAEFENILLIEKYEGEGSEIKRIASETKNVTDISIEEDLEEFPRTVEELAKYEQVILVNVAYSDMLPIAFEEILNEYVYSLGGGLFTVGGRNDYGPGGKLIPHAYNREDIENSLYFKNMLPVNAEDYTPPIAVMLVVDTSLSMKSTGKLSAAIDGAKVCLDALADRDYCGIVSFSSASSERLSILPVAERETIREAIRKVEDDAGGGTIFSDAIMKAGRALSVIGNVERKHIILITDGKPGDSYDDYKKYIDDNVKDGITMSVVTIGMDDVKKQADMQKAAAVGNGKYYNVNDVSSLSGTMYKDLTEEAIPEIQYGEEFFLSVKDKSTVLSGIDPKTLPALTGYYGTVAKKDATVVLMGEYVPIYATHKYGKGKVGSFMCDLSGEWSEEFIQSVSGRALVMNIIESLFPFEDVRADGIKYELKSDNLTHAVNVYGIPEGQTLAVSVSPISSHLQHLHGEIFVSAAETNRRFTFEILEPGLYEIRITATDSEGRVVSEIPLYKTFSYSGEYDSFGSDSETGKTLMASLSASGNGSELFDPAQTFGNIEKTVDREYDPSAILIIVAIALVLLDIAVRKFKIKWLHEVIREHKQDRREK